MQFAWYDYENPKIKKSPKSLISHWFKPMDISFKVNGKHTQSWLKFKALN